MAGDLHTHTTFSDGSTPAELLPLLAARAGLTHLAISDHDSLLSVRYAYERKALNGVELIPATELTAYDFERSRQVHLLCYWPDDCSALIRHCGLMARRRNECCLQSAHELEALYPQFTTAQALAFSRDSGVLYKSNLMQALCQIGLAEAIYGDTYRELFSTNPEHPGRVLHKPAYEPVAQVLQTIRECRGVVVFAHPSVYKSMPLVRQLTADGLIDGVEIEHPRNTEEDKAELRRLAQEYNLIVTGGTDFHGANSKHPKPIGTCVTAADQLQRIRQLAMQRKAQA